MSVYKGASLSYSQDAYMLGCKRISNKFGAGRRMYTHAYLLLSDHFEDEFSPQSPWFFLFL